MQENTQIIHPLQNESLSFDFLDSFGLFLMDVQHWKEENTKKKQNKKQH